MTGPNHVYPAVVKKILDGDTFLADVDMGFRIHATQKIRVKDLWCPELDEPGGADAKWALLEVLGGVVGMPVRLQTIKDEFSFDRWVADVHSLDQGRNVAERMIEMGQGFKTKKELEAWLKAQ